MAITHKGYVFLCDAYCRNEGLDRIEVAAETERTAIRKAREARWFVGTVRITGGFPKSKVRTQRRVLCPACTWIVGARV